MTPEVWMRVRALFHDCLELAPAERAALLDRECPDPDIRREVESLLRSADGAETFLEQPAAVSAAPAGASMQDWIGQRLGAYEIVEVVAAGGMGEVYRAVRADEQYRQEVAIKLIRRGFEGQATLERFRAERQILATLDHPNIARLIDAGLTPTGQPYFVMQYIDGEPIDVYCRHHAVPLAKRLELFCKVCEAVQYAHQHLTVHRDLKPANILVTRDGEPKLLDFGIAKVLASDAPLAATVTAVWAMTPDYASPEQIRGEPITTATDIYSLGVILYRLLTGKSPYQATQTEPYTLARQVCETQPPRPSATLELEPRLIRQIKEDLDHIVLMALRKEAERRYSSAHEFAADIRAYLDGRPVLATPDSFGYRCRKFIGRHRMSVTLGLIGAVAILGASVVIFEEGRVARAAQLRAEHRYSDVRQLANSLIFELDDSIAKLPGGTATRRALVEKAVRYLDALSREAGGDISLQRDLGAAYQKLGDIQGNSVYGNLGLITDAGESYRKAIAIRETLAASQPDDVEDRLALASIYEHFADFLHSTRGDLNTCLQYAEKALHIVQPVYREQPGNLSTARQLLGVYQTIAAIQGGSGSAANLGNVEAAIDTINKAVTVSDDIIRRYPEDDAGRRYRAILSLNVADYLVKQGNRSAAEIEYRKGLAILKRLNAKSPDVSGVRVIGLVSERIANALMMDGDFSGAAGSYQAAHEVYLQDALADPQNSQARFDLASSELLYGNALSQQGDRRRGLELIGGAIHVLEEERLRGDANQFVRRLLSLGYLLRGQIRLAAAETSAALSDYDKASSLLVRDGDDPQAQISVAALEVKRADALAAQKHWDSARSAYVHALAYLEPRLSGSDTHIEVLYAAADAYAGMASLALRQSPPANCAAAKPWLEKSVATWRLVRNPGRFNPSGFASAGPKEPARQLNDCDAAT